LNSGTNDAPAHAQANTYAADNIAADVVSTEYTPDCAAQTVQVAYQDQQDLFFAPVLGFDDETPVVGRATAHWGATQGGNPLPVELDPNLTNSCVYEGGAPGGTYKQPGVCPTGYWFDNADLTKSGWGLMNLNGWDVGAADSCDNKGGANSLSGWILQTQPLSVKLMHLPTYVCTTDGGKTPNWMDSLKFWAGKDRTFLFPINDPAAMILGPPTSIEKYAIVGFAPMQIVDMIRVVSDTAAAVGSSYSCTTTFRFTGPGSTLDLSSATLIDAAGASSDCGHLTRNQISALQLKPATGGGGNYGTSDYAFDGKVITWKRPAANVRITFDYRNGGLCPGHAPDPNAFCLKLAWGGPTIIGSGPTLGYGPGMAIKLVK